MKSHNDEKFQTAAGSAREEGLENKKKDAFVEASNSGQSQNPAYQMPLSAKTSQFVGGVRTSAAAEKQKMLAESRAAKDAEKPRKIVKDKFAANPGKNLPRP